MKKIKILSIIILYFFSNNIYPQYVFLDETFGQNGITSIPIAGRLSQIKYDLTGNIIAIGTNSITGYRNTVIIKTDAHGILDENFGTGGILSLGDFYAAVADLKITNENKILYAGTTPPYLFLKQFNEDGSLDESFGNNGTIIVNPEGIRSICIENDDYFVIGKTVNNRHWVSKYYYNGEIDESFGDNGSVDLGKDVLGINPRTVYILNDQSILVAGHTYDTSPTYNAKIVVCKLTQTGEIITDFANNGIFKTDLIYDSNIVLDESILSIFEDSSGNLILTGFARNYFYNNIYIGKLLSNGTIDATFGENGFVFYEGGGYFPTKTILYEDLYLIGVDAKIRCLNNDGTLNTAFHDNGLFIFENFLLGDIQLQGTDKFIAGGRSGDYYYGNYLLARLDTMIKPLRANAGGDHHFCFSADLIQTQLGGSPTAVRGKPPYTYYWWSAPENLLSEDEVIKANPTINHSGGIRVYVEITDAEENMALDSAVISMSQIPYTFLISPDYLPVEHHILQGDSVWITIDAIVHIADNSTCRWEPAAGLENCNVCNGFWAKPEITTSYFLSVTDEYGCSENVSPFGNTPIYKINVTSNDATLSNLTVSAGELEPTFNSDILNYTVNVVEVEEITITAIPTNSNAAVTGTGTFTLEIGQNNFTINIIAEDEITEINYTILVNNLLSIAETEMSSVTIYPNPTTGELTIDNGELRIENVEVFDIYGSKLSSHHLITSSSHHLINISHLPAGTYFLRLDGIILKVIKK